MAKDLYGDLAEPLPDVLKMFKQGWRVDTISKMKNIPIAKIYETLIDEHIAKGKIACAHNDVGEGML